MYERSSHTLSQHEPIKKNHSKHCLDYKNTFLYFLKISKNVQHRLFLGSFFCFLHFFFCKVMLQHVFNNHNNINMNDIQNSNNNYSRIIALPGSASAPLPIRRASQRSCIRSVFALLQWTCIYRTHRKRRANAGQAMSEAFVVVRARHLSGRCQRRRSKSAAGKS